MFKKILAVLLCFSLLTVVGCKKENNQSEVSEPQEILSEVSSVVPQPVYYVNPLTGVKNLSEEVSKQVPVAIMINNINLAQGVQAGVGAADIVYETEVERGITRLMAVYQDIASVGRIGTIRSARYVYVDLALGHKAIYLHHGQDETYCRPHLKDIKHYTVDTNNCGKRISNGKSREHTLYTDGKGVYNSFVKGNKIDNPTQWQNFAEGETQVTLDGGTATKINVPFSSSYVTGFTYDAATGKYTRLFCENVLKDYITGKATEVKNVFILKTTIYNYSDNYHRNVKLQGGEGYYCVNGTYTKIKWTKGSGTSAFKFANADGSPLTVNPGNSWVCIANSSSNISIN
ncbi:MAG: DUF3048 domain-containing protein [Clostridia bacterium]|nr:DUF3048 domain-containing protein [Clostridia bacterium]